MLPLRPLGVCLAALAIVGGARDRVYAERAPITRYTVADGLPHDRIYRIVPDSRGFLWFSTADGLSRFDGHEFKNYDRTDGLPHPVINDLLQTRNGVYWVATNGGGVAYLEPGTGEAGRDRFVQVPVGSTPGSQRVNALLEDSLGRIWAATDDQVFVSDGDARRAIFEGVELGLGRSERPLQAWDVAEDKAGSVWIATNAGVSRRVRDGRTINYQANPTRARGAVWALELDETGRIWAALDDGVVAFTPPRVDAPENPYPWDTLVHEVIPDGTVTGHQEERDGRDQSPLAETRSAAHWYTALGPGDRNWIRALRRTSDGRVWAGTSSGFVYSFDGARPRPSITNQRLTADKVLALGEDIDGNVWVGTYASGAVKLARHGLVAYGQEDGLSGGVVRSIAEDTGGVVHVVTDDLRVHRFDGARFTGVRPNVPDPVDASHLWHTALQDRRGTWWVTTGEGLFRFPRVTRLEELRSARPVAAYTVVNGLSLHDVRRAFEDSRGDLWLRARAETTLMRWNHRTGLFEGFSETEGLRPPLTVNAVEETRAGQIWIGFREGGAARLREGRFEHVTSAEGAPEGDVQTLFADRAGRLWIGTIGGGVGRIDDPSASTIAVQKYTTSEGLSSNTVRSFTEDRWGRIYVGTAKGVNRLQPDTGRIHVYTVADGLPGNEVHAAYRDRHDRLWFGTSNGVATLVPEVDPPAREPLVRINAVQVAGKLRRLSELGEGDVSHLELGATENQLRIAFFSTAFGPTGSVSYRYRLEGVDRQWSAPTSERSVNYERLPPGHYRFVVGVVTESAPSDRTATVSFYIRPPLWQRWWFILIAGAAIGMALFAVHRARLLRLLEMERVRGRIATDLHDDIGSGLSQIAILSEVAMKQAATDGSAREPLSRIAATSRELVDTMSDIVWAINPRYERLGDLAQRMRRFASDVLASRDIAFRLDVPPVGDHTRLTPDIRREVFLIFKESVTNIVRHSGSTEAEIDLRIDHQQLNLRVRDNGHGATLQPSGNGLASMQGRAARLGGALVVCSRDGQGTTLTLTVPLTT